ncbi:hypothetical protein QJS10_CPA06g02550 [Acorus calamus]|uniref:Uncharacterized protein n=1 Tax=Acorus calamus TaxID=4465 RepID=A0AAV9ERL1_ACOCL|nr:hypothetical protein QJS10_CPA06g02550 [Acorus calamus]
MEKYVKDFQTLVNETGSTGRTFKASSSTSVPDPAHFLLKTSSLDKEKKIATSKEELVRESFSDN